MSDCNVKAGFFVLSECKRPASKTCEKCEKYCCDRHGKMAGDGNFYCLECTVEINPIKGSAKRSGTEYEDEYYDDRPSLIWLYYERDRFYSRENYRPFDEQDYVGFEQQGGLPAMDESLDEGGFFDS